MSALDDACRAYGALHHAMTTENPAREELAALRANQLDPKIVEAVRAYQVARKTFRENWRIVDRVAAMAAHDKMLGAIHVEEGLMTAYVLTRHAERPTYDVINRMVVKAESESLARLSASMCAMGEGRDTWLDPEKSSVVLFSDYLDRCQAGVIFEEGRDG